MIGKPSQKCPITSRCVYSLQYIDTVVDDFETNDYAIQARIGLFF